MSGLTANVGNFSETWNSELQNQYSLLIHDGVEEDLSLLATRWSCCPMSSIGDDDYFTLRLVFFLNCSVYVVVQIWLRLYIW